MAHQGGWDEALFVVVPLVVLAGVLYVAKRRAEAEARALGDRASTERTVDDDGPS